HLDTTLVHVGQQRAAFVADAGTDDDRAGRDVLGLDDAGYTGGGDDDVRLARVPRPVRHAGVDDRHGRVRRRTLLRQQQGERPTDRHPTTEDDDATTRHRYLVVREQRLDARWRAGHGTGNAERHAPDVRRMHAVDILVGINSHEHRVEVD